ncbi:Ethanolamine utilization protein EutN/carboxysome [Roseimaritima multifibrata]|uniref:Ethanolamine utilization protein EutN/carboxysome n=1 Tax=Roseimaritima multifibrata TaxID=1930274 RepID=A0A517MD35_9BACT|nr:EutN/CcmL family microcompartment protein [Roseimaritima multifibrata]QDS92802.1 Ethanolamine utilization protein EutN/carboxysome [Roseimaritima multifibrata]
MKIARTIGTVTLARMHPSLKGASLRCVEELATIDDVDKPIYGGETIVAWDYCGSGIGDRVALAEGPEAAAPKLPTVVPVDAAIVAVLDDID